jgi:hypothetical protein
MEKVIGWIIDVVELILDSVVGQVLELLWLFFIIIVLPTAAATWLICTVIRVFFY